MKKMTLMLALALGTISAARHGSPMPGCLLLPRLKASARVSCPVVLRYNRGDIFTNATGYGYVG